MFSASKKRKITVLTIRKRTECDLYAFFEAFMRYSPLLEMVTIYFKVSTISHCLWVQPLLGAGLV